jgi:hypothetical protein
VGKRLGGLALIVVILALGVFMGSALSQRWQVPEAEGGVLPIRRPQSRVRVEVRNGAGQVGLARAATDVLRDHGFDVVFYGNADAFGRDSSVVLDRVGRVDLARDVADALGIPRVLSQPDSNLYLDATVVLGEDWSAPEPASPSERDAKTPPWWHPKRWVGARKPSGQEPAPAGPVADPGQSDG